VAKVSYACQERRGRPEGIFRIRGIVYARQVIHRLIVLSFAFCLLVPCRAWPIGLPPTPASLAGESLEFRIRWGVIPAGRAFLEVLDDGGGTLRFRARAQTLPVINAIYPVQDFIESRVSLPGAQVLRYYKKAKEGWGRARETEVLFDHPAGLARSFKDGEPDKTVKITADVQDPLSCFYAFRTAAWKEGQPYSLDITDGSKLVTGKVSIIGRETVKTGAGSFRTVIVEPKIEGIGGVFRKSPGARILIWLTDDEWRRPVKLQSEVIVGAFTAELESVRAQVGIPAR